MSKRNSTGGGNEGNMRDNFTATPHTPRVVPSSNDTRTATPHTPRIQPPSPQGGKPQSSDGMKK